MNIRGGLYFHIDASIAGMLCPWTLYMDIVLVDSLSSFKHKISEFDVSRFKIMINTGITNTGT